MVTLLSLGLRVQALVDETKRHLPVTLRVLVELLVADVLQGAQVLGFGRDALGPHLAWLTDVARAPSEWWEGGRLAAEGEHALEFVEVGAQLLYLFLAVLDLSVLLLQEQLEVPDLLVSLAQNGLQFLDSAHFDCLCNGCCQTVVHARTPGC